MDKTERENLIKELIEKTTIPVNKISTNKDKPTTFDSEEDDTIWISVEVNQPHFFWEHGGEALFAINHLARKIIDSKISKNVPEARLLEESRSLASGSNKIRENQRGLGVLIDINGFQKKHIENIHAIAHMMAERAKYFKSNIEVEPMSAFERRIVHEFLSKETDIKTESKGEGLSRQVVIKYIGTI